METSELLKKVRLIEIKTRGLSRNIFAGEYHSAFKGRGMAFAEVREYQPGDDVRFIDWKVTARLNHPYIKVFEEERELTMMLLIDMSGSEQFGSRRQMKQELITEISAVLAFSAIQNNDKIGVIFFTDKMEKFIPPKKGKSHVLRIIRELIDFKPERKGTDIGVALDYFMNVIKKRCTAFLVSDFIGDGYQDTLRAARSKHDLIAMKIYDPTEAELPSVGLIRLRDAETGKETWVDTSMASVRTAYKKAWLQADDELQTFLRKNGIDYVKLGTNQEYIKPLMNFFKSR